MVKRIIFSLIVCILLVQAISAIDTEIKINTLSNHTLNLQFLNQNPPPISFESITNNSGESGEFSYVFSNSATSFDLSVFLIKENKKILYERFEDIISGKIVVITFIPGVVEIDKDYQEVQISETQNQTEENEIIESNVTNETSELENMSNESSSKITGEVSSETESWFFKFFKLIGLATSEESDSSSINGVYYAVGIIVLLFLAYFIIKKTRNKTPKKIKIRKLSEMQEEKKKTVLDSSTTSGYKKIIEEDEKKIREAQEEIAKLKKEDRIKAAKQKLIEDEKELMRLREEEREDKKEREKEKD